MFTTKRNVAKSGEPLKKNKVGGNYAKVFSSTSHPCKQRKAELSLFSTTYSRIYVPNETEPDETLRFYEPSERSRWIPPLSAANSQLSRCTGLVFRDFVVWVRTLAIVPLPPSPDKRRSEEKRNRWLSFIPPRHDFAARDPTIARTYLSFFFFSRFLFPSSLLRSSREGIGGVVYFCTIHESRRGWRGWRGLFAKQFAILNHCLSGWYPLYFLQYICVILYDVFFMRVSCPPVVSYKFTTWQASIYKRENRYGNVPSAVLSQPRKVIKNCTVLLLPRLCTTSKEYFQAREYNRRCFNRANIFLRLLLVVLRCDS